MSEQFTQETDFLNDDNKPIPEGQFPKGMGKRIAIVLAAAVCAVLLYYQLPFGEMANKGLALLLFIGVLWLTEAIHITATAILVPILAVLIGIEGFDTKAALANFAHPIIYVFFGGFALAATLHVQKLDKKIAYSVISLAGGHLGRAVGLIFAVTAGLSMWMNNTATTAMMLPLAIGLLSSLDAHKDRNTFIFVLLGIAYSASIGGLGTLVGSAPNGIAAKEIGVDFAGWMRFGLPIVFVMMPALLGAMYLMLRPTLNKQANIQTETIAWTLPRLLTLGVFLVTALAWVFGKKIEALFGFGDSGAVVAILAVACVLTFGLVSWKQVSDNTDWGVLLLFGGGLALSGVMKNSGASEVLANLIASFLATSPVFVILLAVAAFIIFLTEVTSNTASAALLVPLFAPIGVQLGLPAEVLVMIIGIGASCAFMLPVATPPNAIVMGTGHIRQKDMMKVGLLLNIIAIVIVTFWAYFFLI